MHPASHRSLHCQVLDLQQGGSSDQELQKKKTSHGKQPAISVFMSSSPHSTVVPSNSDNENTIFSTNILNYFPASPGNISPNSLDDFTKYLLDILFFPPLHDDPYIQTYDTIPPPQVTIALLAVLPPSLVLSLSPMFDSQDSFSSKKISSPKDTETPISPSSSVGSSSPVRSTTPPPDYLFNVSIFTELDNSLWITS
ncbi:hypothetical protein Tco_1103770 [Tanacetum coccineum]